MKGMTTFETNETFVGDVMVTETGTALGAKKIRSV
jgi:hypothetical protein